MYLMSYVMEQVSVTGVHKQMGMRAKPCGFSSGPHYVLVINHRQVV